ncbi:MAG: 4-hydroxybenzoate octaprenyltransferase [Alphaproteobacteria bacterium]|nr:4-hydroxybenzoate octaprenyltransferase [Alphaproteobacteria bacterium]
MLSWTSNISKKLKLFLILGRYNYPTGAFLLMLPCFWGVFYQINPDENLIKIIFLFIIGSFVMRGAGCCINDFFDKDLDKKVSRTKNRPLASGALSNKEASLFILLQLIIGFLVVVNFNIKTIFFSFLIIPMVLIYPLMKRVTNFPQLFLGFVFNWGVIVGYLSQSNLLNLGIIFLFFGGIFFTVAYDTIYAIQDLKDDKKFGIKSLAIFLEKKPKQNIFYISLLSYIFLTLSIMQIDKLSLNLSLFLSLPILICFILQFYLFHKKLYKIVFDSSALTGLIISLVFLITNYL